MTRVCNPKTVLFLAGGLFFLLLAIMHFNITFVKSDDIDISVSHGTTRHPYEAEMTRKCLDEHGSLATFKLGNRFLETCDLEDGWFGIRIITKVNGRWVEVSAYVPKLLDKTFNGLVKWLLAQGWTRYTKEL